MNLGRLAERSCGVLSSRKSSTADSKTISTNTTTSGEVIVAAVTLFYQKADVYTPFARSGHLDIREYISLQSTHSDYRASCLLVGLD